MALISLTWDLPPENQMETYLEKARTEWIPSILTQPGLKEFRAYRNPLQTTPQVLSHVEFDDLQSLESYLQSMAYAVVISGLNGVGCTRVSAQVWDASPVAPEPLKPTG